MPQDTFIVYRQGDFLPLNPEAVIKLRKPGKSSGHGGFGESRAEYRPERSSLNENAQECANYIAELTLELRNLAKRNELKFLAQLLEMTFQGAFVLAHKVEPTASDLQRLTQTRETR
jgi:hypothetical protein